MGVTRKFSSIAKRNSTYNHFQLLSFSVGRCSILLETLFAAKYPMLNFKENKLISPFCAKTEKFIRLTLL